MVSFVNTNLLKDVKLMNISAVGCAAQAASMLYKQKQVKAKELGFRFCMVCCLNLRGMNRDSDLLLSEEELLKAFRARVYDSSNRRCFTSCKKAKKHLWYQNLNGHIDPNQTNVGHCTTEELLIVVEQSLCGSRKQLSRCHFWEEIKKGNWESKQNSDQIQRRIMQTQNNLINYNKVFIFRCRRDESNSEPREYTIRI